MSNYTNVTSYQYNPVILMTPSLFGLLFYIFIVLIFAAIHPVWARVDKYTLYGTLKTTTTTVAATLPGTSATEPSDETPKTFAKTTNGTSTKSRIKRPTTQNDPRIRFVI